MKKNVLSLVLALAIILSITAVPAVAAETPSTTPVFTDVPADAWYAEAVNALAEGGLVEGIGDNKFNPNGEVTYGELVAILGRLYYSPNYVYDPIPQGNPVCVQTWGSAYGWKMVNARRMLDTAEDVENGTNGPAVHWAARHNISMAINVMNVVETEDLDVPAIRGSAIEHIAYAAINAKTGAPTYVNNYTPADIPDWNDVLGIKHETHDPYAASTGSVESKTVHVWPIDDELHFLPDDYVMHALKPYAECAGYNMDSVAANDLDGQTYVFAHPDLVLRAYNMGITEGVDETHACNVYGHLTRAELCAMLYRAGLTKASSCNWPEPAAYYDGKEVTYYDNELWK